MYGSVAVSEDAAVEIEMAAFFGPRKPPTNAYRHSLQVLEAGFPESLSCNCQANPGFTLPEIARATAPRAGLCTPWLLVSCWAALLASATAFTAQPRFLLGVSPQVAVAAWMGAALCAAGLTIPIAGNLADRGHRTFVVAAGLGLNSLCSLALCLCEPETSWGPEQWGPLEACVIGARVLQGSSSGMVLTGTLSLLVALTHPLYRTRGFGAFLCCAHLGRAFGLLAASQLAIRDLHVAASAACGLGAVFSGVVLSEYRQIPAEAHSWCCWLPLQTLQAPGVLISSAVLWAACFGVSLQSTVLATGQAQEWALLDATAAALFAAGGSLAYLCVRLLNIGASAVLSFLLSGMSVLALLLWHSDASGALLGSGVLVLGLVAAVVSTVAMAVLFAAAESLPDTRHELTIRSMLVVCCLGHGSGVGAGLVCSQAWGLLDQLRWCCLVLSGVWGVATMLVLTVRLDNVRLWPLEPEAPEAKHVSSVQPRAQLLSLASKWRVNSSEKATELSPYAAKIITYE